MGPSYRGFVPHDGIATRRMLGGVQPVDVLAALLVAFIDVGGTILASHHHPSGSRTLDAFGVALLAIGAASVAYRRRAPVAVLWIAFGTTFAYTVLEYPSGPHWAALVVALFTAMFTGHRVAAVASLTAGYVAFTWERPLFHQGAGPGLAAVFGLLAWLLVLFGVAEAFRIRAERAREAERMREEEARRRASEERLQIAREIHDVVAHNMSLINVQAGAALHRFDDDQEQARAALAAIKDASKEALVELRSVLGVLRRVDEDAPRSPTPGAGRLAELVTQSAAAGLDVDLVTEGHPRPLPPAVDVAAYRIVQEALTNVARHSGTTAATVRVEYGDHDLVIEVDDRGRAPVPAAARSGGSGIAGMKERADLLGGTLQAGPRPDGGFRVRAWFPAEHVE
jgi:signal transduction histidine kinase